MTVRLPARLRRLWRDSRPVHRDTEAALARRWSELPDHVRSDAQLLGRRTAGCEGTHGVFPRCDLACTPCYHAKEAQRVRTDGGHTAAEVERQMAFLRTVRGTGQHAQLIGGEVSLLSPDDHALALQIMHRHGRKPISMTHGDFDYDYLRALAVGPDGRRRFDLLRVAAHVDALMLGRRAVARPRSEAQLHDERRRIVAMFDRLHDEYGVRPDLAHNMTVTPSNLAQVADVARTAMGLRFGMASFQPAAHVGNAKRWREDYRRLTVDDVWAQLEAGAGTRLPWRHLQMGDERCNRAAYGLVAAGRWFPWLDDQVAGDLHARDRFLAGFGGMDFDRPRGTLILAVARVLVRHPRLIGTAAAWTPRFVRRVGARRLLGGGLRPFTFVVHAFMDTAVVRPAWEALERGEIADDPDVRAAQERLQACSYAMAHPEDGRTVPACVQHSVLDPAENLRLLGLLPRA
ncbi:MAG: radical SAM domain-containing protein [Solirubrobacterales bacterium]|nr:radical SAM domain-containing protein [Solirubrobacterales bacterium]